MTRSCRETLGFAKTRGECAAEPAKERADDEPRTIRRRNGKCVSRSGEGTTGNQRYSLLRWRAFFDRLGPAGCAPPELVTVDLAANWPKAQRARAAQARRVFDRFHVEQLASEAVDEVRRAEQWRLGSKASWKHRGMRGALLKPPKRLKPGERW